MSSKLSYFDPGNIAATDEVLDTDVCIYGANAAGVMAAVQVAKMGRDAVLLEPGGHIGGLTAGGLSFTDFGNKDAVGGLAREFYRRAGQRYGVEEEWTFEPHVAEQVLAGMLPAAPILYQYIDGVEKEGAHIRSISLLAGRRVRARVYIDCSYEGDLMALAGVSYHVGREGNAVYDESLNGAQINATHQFDAPVSPYVVEHDPDSGFLPGIEDGTPEIGAGDRRIQAYNFRLCLAGAQDSPIPFAKPDGYNPAEYVLLARYLRAGFNEVFRKFDPIRANKVDMNNHGAVSTDFIGRNYRYPEAGYAERETIFQSYVTYQQGLMWFLANSPDVPEAIRERMNEWGLPRDEFVDTGGWPHQLYVREARRMVSDYVMTEHDCLGRRARNDSICLGSYHMDSHNCRRFVDGGSVMNEGDVQHPSARYPISYRSMTPRQAECENLLVPVCLSASHIAYGSIRMEPVFMALGQSAATAAILSLESKVPVQGVSYDELRAQLIHDHQVLNA